MKRDFKLQSKLLILFTLLLCVQSCDYIREQKSLNSQKSPEIKPLTQHEISKIEEKKKKNTDDSLSILLSNRYPSAYNLDSLKYSFTIVLQDALEKSEKILYIRETFLKDIERLNSEKYISLYSFFPKTFLKLRISPKLFDLLYKEVVPFGYDKILSVIIKVDSMSTIQAELSCLDSDDGVRLGVTSNLDPVYFLRGELIDFYL